MSYDRAALIQLQGIHQVGTDGFMQFYVDEAFLQKMIVDLFYEEVK